MAKKLTRLEDWPERLAKFLYVSRNIPFSWNGSHCGLFALKALEAQTGRTDLIPEWVIKLKTEKELYSALRQRFDGGVYEAATEYAKRFGMIECPVALAGRGCIAFIDQDPGALGVVDLSGENVVARTGDGAINIKLDDCATAWRFG